MQVRVDLYGGPFDGGWLEGEEAGIPIALATIAETTGEVYVLRDDETRADWDVEQRDTRRRRDDP